jgi:hypothetical protein
MAIDHLFVFADSIQLPCKLIVERANGVYQFKLDFLDQVVEVSPELLEQNSTVGIMYNAELQKLYPLYNLREVASFIGCNSKQLCPQLGQNCFAQIDKKSDEVTFIKIFLPQSQLTWQSATIDRNTLTMVQLDQLTAIDQEFQHVWEIIDVSVISDRLLVSIDFHRKYPEPVFLFYGGLSQELHEGVQQLSFPFLKGNNLHIRFDRTRFSTWQYSVDSNIK